MPTRHRVEALSLRALVPVSNSAKSPLHVRFLDQHATGFRAFVAGDDAAALEHVDQAARTGIAHAETALQEARRGRLGGDDDLDRALEQRVLVGVELTVRVVVFFGWRLGRLEQALVELLLALGPALLD